MRPQHRPATSHKRPTTPAIARLEEAERSRLISPDDRQRIRQLHAAGLPTRAIAKRQDCSQSSVWRIIHEPPAPSQTGVPDDARFAIILDGAVEFFTDQEACSRRWVALATDGKRAAVWKRAEVAMQAQIK